LLERPHPGARGCAWVRGGRQGRHGGVRGRGLRARFPARPPASPVRAGQRPPRRRFV